MDIETLSDADDDGPLVPTRDVLRRYSIVDRTLDRWLADPELGFPRPIVVRKRRYFHQRKLASWERQQARGVVTS
jgi:hypothetical protein